MGGIDIDPATSAGNPTGATIYYTKETDGLSKPWVGRLWLNPPYGLGLARWMHKLIEELEQGRVSQVICLIPVRTGAKWFHRLCGRGASLCFPRPIKFVNGLTGEQKATALMPNVIVYLGDRHEEFRKAFQRFGLIATVQKSLGDDVQTPKSVESIPVRCDSDDAPSLTNDYRGGWLDEQNGAGTGTAGHESAALVIRPTTHVLRASATRRNSQQPHAIFADNTPPLQLFHGDCLTVLPTLPEKSVDLILTDLPSGVTACEWDSIMPLDKLWQEYRRVAKETTAFVFTATQPFTTALISSNLEWFRYELIWEKPQGTNPLNAKKMPLKSHESIVVFYQKQPTYNPQMEKGVPYSGFETKNGAMIGEVYGGSKSIHAANSGTRYPKSVLRFKQERGGLHPTQKPVSLMEYLIRTYGNEGDVVLDSCMGSATTGVAAVNTKRKFIGIELDSRYFATAKKRLEPKVNRDRPAGANRSNVISMTSGEPLDEQSGVRASGLFYCAKGASPAVKRRVPTLFWACPRPKTKHWGSGQVWDRICRIFGTPDAAFGKTDGIPEGIAYYDLSNGYDWKRLLLPDDYHLFGFWDPPYFNDDHTRFKMFKREAQEIWRVCKRLAILHPLVYPTSWFAGAGREALVAVTFGSLKMIRCLSIFTKE